MSVRGIARGVARAVTAVAVLVLVAVAVAALGVPVHAAHAATVAHAWTMAPALGLAGMIVVPWSPPYTRDQLDAMASPQLMNQPEVVPWQLYDTATIANAAAGPFTFFTALNADKTLCNMEGPGQLPDPQYFIVQYVAADFLQAPTAGDATTTNAMIANFGNLIYTTRPTFTFNISNKRYGPFSLTMCHATGGLTGFAAAEGATAGGYTTAVVNNGIVGSGGFPLSGAVVIPPKIGFDVTVNLGAAATLTANVLLRVSLVGALYRRVL